MKQNSFEIITPKERLHMNKIKANYDDVIIEFEIDKNRLTVKAENLPNRIVKWKREFMAYWWRRSWKIDMVTLLYGIFRYG